MSDNRFDLSLKVVAHSIVEKTNDAHQTARITSEIIDYLVLPVDAQTTLVNLVLLNLCHKGTIELTCKFREIFDNLRER